MEEYRNTLDGRFTATRNGGAGSGNFGHSGRPGKVGGSGKGSGSSSTSSHSYAAVAEATMLRDYIEPEYLDDEHKMLCDIADALYGANIGPEYLTKEAKEVYDRYGEDFWNKTLEDMGAIDDQIGASEGHKAVDDLILDYQDRVKANKGEEKATETKTEKSERVEKVEYGTYLDSTIKTHLVDPESSKKEVESRVSEDTLRSTIQDAVKSEKVSDNRPNDIYVEAAQKTEHGQDALYIQDTVARRIASGYQNLIDSMLYTKGAIPDYSVESLVDSMKTTLASYKREMERLNIGGSSKVSDFIAKRDKQITDSITKLMDHISAFKSEGGDKKSYPKIDISDLLED